MKTTRILRLSLLIGCGIEALLWLALGLGRFGPSWPSKLFLLLFMYGHYPVGLALECLPNFRVNLPQAGDMLLMFLLNAAFISLLVFAILSVVGKLRARHSAKP